MKMTVHSIARKLRCQGGNVMIEFAIGATVLLAGFGGTFQFGYTFYEYNILKNAVNDGAHYASLQIYDSNNATPSNSFKQAVRNMVVYGNPAGGTNPVTPGLATANVNVTATFAKGVPSAMTVSIAGYTVNAVFGSTTFNGKPTATYAYQGIYEPL
jgi:Flp pilus assembly protein TadG